MAVRIRMKRLGRKHRPFFRICAMEMRVPRDGRVLEELGTYDPMVSDVDARVTLNGERVDHWVGHGAIPSDNVRVFIKKYGTNGTHLDKMQAARERLALPKIVPPAPEAVYVAEPAKTDPAPEAAAATTEEPAESTKPAEAAAPAKPATAEEAKTEEASAEKPADKEEKTASE